MFHPVSLFIGLRYSRSRHGSGFVSFITFFSIAGILLGVASLITVVSVMNGFEGELKKRILGIVPHIVVENEQDKIKDWKALREQYLQVEQVNNVSPVIENEGIVQSYSQMKMISMQGIYPEFEQTNIVSSHMSRGQVADLAQYKYGAIIGASLARQLEVNRGDTIRLILPNQSRYTPMGRVPMQRKFTVVGIFDVGSQVDDSVVYIHAKAANKMLRRKPEDIRKLRLYLDDAFMSEEVINNLPNTLSSYKHTDWRSSQGTLFAAVSMEKNMMALSLFLIIAIAAFNVVSSLVMVVINKQGEISILQTFGMNRSGIVKIFVSQGMINGLWGAIIGGVLGVILTLNLNSLLSLLGVNLLGNGMAQQLPVDLNIVNVATILSMAILMSFVATLYPAYRASNTLPAEVLRHE